MRELYGAQIAAKLKAIVEQAAQWHGWECYVQTPGRFGRSYPSGVVVS